MIGGCKRDVKGGSERSSSNKGLRFLLTEGACPLICPRFLVQHGPSFQGLAFFNFGVAGCRDFAVRDQLQPNAAGTAWVKNVPMSRSNIPKTESHERNPTYSIFRGMPRALRSQQSAQSYQPTIVGLGNAVCYS